MNDEEKSEADKRLEQLRELSTAILECADAGGGVHPSQARRAVLLAKAIQELDTSLQNGGDLPGEWL